MAAVRSLRTDVKFRSVAVSWEAHTDLKANTKYVEINVSLIFVGKSV